MILSFDWQCNNHKLTIIHVIQFRCSMSGTTMKPLRKIDRQNIEDIFALTPMQEGMLFHYLRDSQSQYYSEQLSLGITGEIDMELFKKAWNLVVETNDMLRTVFRWEKIEKPVQVILKVHNLQLEYYDISTRDAGEKKKQLEEIRVKDRGRNFDFRNVPFRVTLCKIEPGKYEMIISNHHILYDGWSNGIILKEFFSAYNDLVHGKKLTIPGKTKFKEFVKLIRAQDLNKQEKSWEDYLRGFDTKTRLPVKTRKRTGRTNTENYQITLTAVERKKLESFAQGYRITRAALLYTAWGVLLQKYNNSDDVIFGITVSGRSASLGGIEDMVGLFINTLPLRIQTNSHETARELLYRIDNALQMLKEFEVTSTVNIKKYSEIDNTEELFDSIVVIENYPLDSRLISGSDKLSLSVDSYSMVEMTHYDLTIAISIIRDMEVTFSYKEGLFEEETIVRLAHHFRSIVKAIMTDPGKEIAGIEIISGEEKHKILFEFNKPGTRYPGDKTVQQLFAGQVERTPDQVALVGKEEGGKGRRVEGKKEMQLSYRELNGKADRLAYILKEKGVKPDTIVGIKMERSIEIMVGIWAILKAGGVYLPIDPGYPEQRIQYMLNDSNASILLTHQDTAPSSSTLTSTSTCQVSPTNLVYVIYTSGSTGKPKGVLVEHRNLTAYIQAFYREFVITANDTALQQASFAFDAFVEEVYPVLLKGGKIAVPTAEEILDIHLLRAFIVKNRVTIISCSPLLLKELNSCNRKDLDTIHTFISGGDVLRGEYIDRLLQIGTVYNTYGPTETTVCVTYYKCLKNDISTIPIGKPIANYKVYILSKDNQLQPIGVGGELCVSGAGVTRGYLNNPELTAKRFYRSYRSYKTYIFRTGDLARWLSDGNIEFLGRIDQQVKIRGFRIELGEIESRLVKHERIKDAVVVDSEDAAGEKYLCAYVVYKDNEQGTALDSAPGTGELRDYLLAVLPGYMIPAYFVPIDGIPLTPSGKVDRKALPASKFVRTREYSAPGNMVEKTLIEIWSRVLGEDLTIGIDDDFFELGGHSLKAVAVVSKIYKELEVKIPLAEVFKRRTVRQLAEYIEKTEAGIYVGIEPGEKKEFYPLSSAQGRFYVLQQLTPGSTAYNMASIHLLAGHVEKERFENTLEKLITRHESLRTSFEIANGEPVQKVHPAVDFEIGYYDISEIKVEKEEQKAEDRRQTTEERRQRTDDRGQTTENRRDTYLSSVIRHLSSEFIRPFDLSRAPLLRLGLIKLEEEKHILMFDMHHIITDGVSLTIFLKEWMTLYAGSGISDLQPLVLQYKDFTRWQHDRLTCGKLKKQEMYWMERFAGELPVLNMPTDFPHPPQQSFEGDRFKFILEKTLAHELKRLLTGTGTTLFMVLLAVFNVILAKYTGQEDIVIGTTIAGRHHPDLQDIIGLLIETLALRNFPGSEWNFSEFLNDVKQGTLEAYENQDYPFKELIRMKGAENEISRNPVFDTMLIVQNFENTDFELEGLRFLPYPPSEENQHISKVDFTIEAVEIDEKEEIEFSLEYCTRLYKRETMVRFARHFINIAREVIKNPGIRLSAIRMISQEEIRQLLEEFNDTSLDYSYSCTQTAHELFARQVERTPDRIALVGKEEGKKGRRVEGKKETQLSYRELNGKANRLAHILKEKGVKPDTIVGIKMERSIEIIVGILAILKAGGAYLPIDPGYPEQRIQYMFNDSNASILLTHQDTAPSSSTLTSTSTCQVSPTNLAYVIYTSGSTGKPKGVMVEQRNLTAYIQAFYREFVITANDTVLQQASFAFDAFVEEVYPVLLRGGKIAIPSPEEILDIHLLLEFIVKNRVTLTSCSPLLLNELNRCKSKELDTIHTFISGGDVLRGEYIDRLLQIGTVYNTYGPTETTVCVTYYKCLKDNVSTIPIGKPISNYKVYILGKDDQLQPIGVSGELCVSGAGVTRGYLNNPELTAKLFYRSSRSHRSYKTYFFRTGDWARWLLDGNIEFLGRIDRQVKIRGYRIELGEIETRLLKHDEIKEAVVVTKEDRKKDRYICAYIVSKVEPHGSVHVLKEYLSKFLPAYMVPLHFIFLEQVPLTPSGKPDRKLLPEPEPKAGEIAAYMAPGNKIEEKLLGIWYEVLGQRLSIGIDHNFFDLGGHSLTAMNLIAQIHKQLEVKVPLSELFKRPTIRELAVYIKQAGVAWYINIDPLEKREYFPMSSAQKRLYFLQQMDPGSTVYNIPRVLPIGKDVDKDKLEFSLKQLIARQESLRTSFFLVEDEPMQRIHNKVEFEIEYYDTSSFIRPFDLSQAPLIRSGIIKLPGGYQALMVDCHHIISDGTSQTIITEDLIALYNNNRLEPLRLQYKEFSQWQNHFLKSAQIKAQEDYWLRMYPAQEDIPRLALPTDHERPPVFTFAGDSYRFKLEKEDAVGIRALGSLTGGTLFMNILAVLDTLFYKYTGQTDIIIGTGNAGRPHPHLQPIVGMFINTLAMRNCPDGEKTYKNFIKEVSEQSIDAFENQDLQFEELVDKLNLERDPSRNPLFDISMIVQNFADPGKGILKSNRFGQEQSISEKSTHQPVPGFKTTAKTDMTFYVYEEEGEEDIDIDIEYYTGVFTAGTIKRLASHFKNIVKIVTQKPGIRLKNIEMISWEEKNQVLYEFNDTAREYPGEKVIHRLFEEQAEETPDYIAIVGPSVGAINESPQYITYRKLNEQSNRWAYVLKKKGVGADIIVGIMVEPSVEMIIGLLGILKAGGVYLPIDPGYPEQRIQYMLNDSNASILLTHKDTTPSPSTLTSTSTCQVSPTNLAYVIYTSGTTGKPKGVNIEHRSLVNYVNWRLECYNYTENDVTLQLLSFSFDGFGSNLYSSLLSGGKLVMMTKDKMLDYEYIVRRIRDSQVTNMSLVPGMYVLLLENSRYDDLRWVRFVVLAGEKASSYLVQKSKGKNPRIKLTDEYGPTEATITAAANMAMDETNTGIIGHPISNVRVYILDNGFNIQPIGVVGELCIKGLGVAHGFLNNPELTAEHFYLRRPGGLFSAKGDRCRFQVQVELSKTSSATKPSLIGPPCHGVPWTPRQKLLINRSYRSHMSYFYRSGDLARWLPDGNIEFQGRIDRQVKIRGFRIELAEIENRLLKHKDIKEAVVVMQLPGSLGAYFVPTNKGVVPGRRELEKYLSKTLPSYMIPSYFVPVNYIPLTPHGKVDEKALPAPMITREKEISTPRNTIERKLVKIWQEVLGLRDSSAGIDDNFFELGGHSLKATTLISRIHKSLGVKLPLAEVFKRQTIRKLAEYIQEAGQSKYASIEPAEKKDYYPLSSAQKRMYFLQQLIDSPSGRDMNGTAYNMPLVLFPASDIEKDKLESTLKKLVARHESLRTSFHMIDGMPVQEIHDEVNFEIDYYQVEEEEQKTEDRRRKTEGKSATYLSSVIRHLSSKFVRPFDLSQAPLLRSGLIELPDSNYIWIVDTHHIISDGTSHTILTGDFISLYKGEELEPLRLHYKDFSQWQNRLFESGEIKSQEDYWHKLYGDPVEIPRLALPTDHKRPEVFTFVGDYYHFVLEGEDAEKFKALAAGIGGTLYMNILAALNILFYKYTGQTDIIIGTGIAGRPHADLQRIIGMFVNTVAMRNYPKPGKTYEFFLKEVIANSIDAFENQEVQFEDLVDKLDLERNPSRNPLFDISMVVQDFTDLPQLLPANENPPPPDRDFKNTTAKFDMTFFIYESEEDIHMDIEYYTGIFKKETIQRLVSHFKNVIQAVAKQPSIKLPDIDILTEEEKKQLLYEFNDTAAVYPKDKTIHRLFAEQVERTPDYIAVVGHNEGTRGLAPLSALMSITYKEFNQKSNQLANYLYKGKHLQPEDPVGILMSSSLSCPIAIISILQAGGVYVPIDPSLPLERIKYIINDAGIGTVISEKKHIKTLNQMQWECRSFHSYLGMDSFDIQAEEEAESNELMDRELWHHVGETAVDDITGGGWTSSYTGEPFSRKEMDEYGDNILEKLTPLLHTRMRVLEIGCASGITMFRIAPLVGFYYGTDLSEVIIRENKNRIQQEGHQNIKLSCLAGHEIHRLEEKNFDLVIMNSVIQCFHGHHYLQKVIKKAVDLLGDYGYLFIGDIMDQEKKDTMIRDLTAFKRHNTTNGKNSTARTKTDFSSELFISRQFWEDLETGWDEIETVECSDKIFTIKNELTQFRYDVLVKVNKTNHHKDGIHHKRKRNRIKYREDMTAVSCHKDTPLSPDIAASNLAYIIYTSGTTGKPKGVAIQHQGIANLNTVFSHRFHIDPSDNIIRFANISFDASIWEMFMALLNGASLHLLMPETINDYDLFNRYLGRNHITIATLPPTYANHLNVEALSGLRILITAGSPPNIDFIKKCEGYFRYINAYGPTEYTICTSYWSAGDTADIITTPIGKPIDNTVIYIIDANMSLQPIGVPGELCISGAGLARGYLNNPELTVERFCLRQPGGALFEKTAPPGPPCKNFPLHRSYRSHMSYISYLSYFYRTGDLARWLPDGNIEFQGRIDNQVKIRGLRIEPGEIETRLLDHDAIKEAIVTARQRTDEDEYLCAYIVANPEFPGTEAKALREHLAHTLPDYMIPSYFIYIDRIPLTPSGKVDRKQLPEPRLQEVAGDETPKNKLEKKLAEIWSEVLAVNKDLIGIHHNFFEIGGHSLKATILTSKIHKELNIKLPLAEVFKHQTIRAQAEYIKQAEQNKYAAIEPVEKKEYYALSSAQKRLYFLQQMNVTSTAYNMPQVLLLKKDVEKVNLESTIKKLIRRHESLRTSFEMVHGKPVQRIHDEVEFEIDLYQVEEEEQKTEDRRQKTEGKSATYLSSVIRHLSSKFVRPFDLTQAPLLRSSIIKLPDGNHTWLLDMHHIISDGTSHTILTGDFLSLYNREELEPLRLQYKDFSAWQDHLVAGGKIKSQEDYWLELYRDAAGIPRLDLPIDYKRPEVFTFEGDHYGFMLEREDAAKFKALCSGNKGTLYMNILAALDTLFYKYTGQEDIIIGSGIAGRPHADLQPIIGMFVNTLAMRNYPDGEKTYRTFLKEVIAHSIKALENQDVQFEELVDQLDPQRDPSRNPLFDISMVVQNFIDNQQLEENLKKDHIGLKYGTFKFNTTKFDMTFFIHEFARDIYIDIEYYTAVFKKETIQRIAQHFKNVIKAVIEKPSIKLKEINIITPEEKRQVLYEFNDTAKVYPQDKTIHQLYEEQVEKTPDYIALVGQNEGTRGLAPLSALMSITYQELNQKANQLANYLYNEKHIQPQEPVGILMSQPIDLAVSILGTLKAGAAYVPLEPSLPEERIKYMINDTCIGTVISGKRYIKTLDRLQWECHGFHSYLCMDSENIQKEEEVEKSESMREELWNHVAQTAADEITGGGWVSSYTGEPFSKVEMDEYGDNILKKLEPLLHPQMHVLEIGIGSGLTMYRIAPKVGQYYGTDLSAVMIDKNKKQAQQEKHKNIDLFCLSAHEIDKINQGNFDLIIMNSVIQCFHGHRYLRKVIKQCIHLLAKKGYLFIGDIMDQQKKNALVQEMVEYRNKGNKTKTDFSSELFVAHGFWQDIAAQWDEIEHIDFSRKIYTIENELTKFRYDTLITINKNRAASRVKKPGKQKYQDDKTRILDLSKKTPARQVPSKHLAYIIYTSGTTGQPKGVEVEHRGAVNTLWSRKCEYQMNPGHVALQLFSYAFDGFVTGFFTPAISGARVVLLDTADIPDVDKIRHAIVKNRVTHFISVPPLYTLLLESLTKKEFSTLETVTLAGDKITAKLLEKTKEKKENLEIVNEYGVTEASVMSTIYRHQQHDEIIKIGHPIWNTRLYILDEQQQPQPPCVSGELCIAGRSLARGYLNNPELTAERFRRAVISHSSLISGAGTETRPYILKNLDNPQIPPLFCRGDSPWSPHNFTHHSPLTTHHSPVYRTGDLARWLPDGNIEFLGRIDHQLKIRGFRIEPGEIENRLSEHDTVKEAIVSPNQQADGDRYLCAYIVPKPTAPGVEINMLRKFLALTLPDYMIPSYFILIDKIPLTPSGKVDRKKLPKPIYPEVGGYQAPRDKLQEKLVEIWSEVLAMEPGGIGIHHNFFEIGGHSLKATILTSKIHKELNIKIPLAEVFKRQTIQALAEYIKQAEENKYNAIEPLEKKEYYALSSAQKRMYFLQQVDLNSTAYNMPLVLPLGRDLEKDKLENTIKRLITRHESLRTSIHTIDGMPVQEIQDKVKFEIEYYQLEEEEQKTEDRRQRTGSKSAIYLSSVIRHLSSEFIRPFDLSQAPLMRSGLIRQPDGTYTWIVDMHHIISDGTSHAILAGDFATLYNGDEIEQLRLQYKDFSGWQNHLFESGEIKLQEDYWLELYAHPGEIPRSNLPTDYNRPDVFTFVGNRYEFKLETEHAAKFRALGSRNGATLYMNILAALNTLFYKYTSQEDIIIGSGIAGRPHADLQRIIGMFVNTLAMRNYPNPEITYESFLKQVAAHSVKAFENQDVQFEELVDRLNLERDLSRNPLFDISMVVQNFMDLPNTEEDESHTKEFPDFEYNTSKFDMTFFIYEKGDDVYFHLEYYTGIFKEETIKRLVSHFKNVIKAAIEEPAVKLKDIDIISLEEKTQLLYEFNDTAKTFPEDKTIHQLFEEQAERTPDYIALVGDKGEGEKGRRGEGKKDAFGVMHFTYRELKKASNRLANYLYEEKHIQPQEPAGILMSQPIDLAVGILGILKAGAAYVPLDPALPGERIKYMINDACIGTVISGKRYIKTLNRLQWECNSFHSYLCLDSENIHREDEVEKSELMAEELWNHVGETAVDEITGGGWTSSYTGELLSREEMDEYGDNILKKLQPLLHPGMRVLEIGCASGITMYRIAPKVGLYYGTDLSDAITRKNKSKVQQEGHQNIKLSCTAAHEIHQIEEKDFDLIIMNSVIQCFHGHNYLRKVMQKAIDLLKDKGHLFIGDIMDQEKKPALIRELMIFKNAHQDKNYKTKTDFSPELFVSRGFWNDLQAEFETIESVEFSDKIYTIENELTKFRYDTLMTINKHSPPGKKRKKQKYQEDRRTLSLFSLERLVSNVSGSPAGLAYIIYTSGTTGQPRGVSVEHQGAVNTLWYRKEEYGMNPGCVTLQLFSYGFDGFIASFFTPIISGAQQVLLNTTDSADIDKIRHALTKNSVTHFICVPPLYSLLLESLTKKELSTLKAVTLAGDKITLKLVERTGEKNKNLEIVNEYGVTEASVMSTIYRHQESDPIIKIGHPIGNTRVYILNESQHLQPIGAAGELCISGRGLARGCLNNPGLTGERFIRAVISHLSLISGAGTETRPYILKNLDNPQIPPLFCRGDSPWSPHNFTHHSPLTTHHSPVYRTGDLARWLPDGNIEFLGRIDHQVKIRGFRIEPGEIESCLAKHDTIKEAVIIERVSPGTGDKYLCAYIVPGNVGPAPGSTELKSFLSQTLPGYMIPRYFVTLEQIPLTPNGKLDRKKLPGPEPGFTVGDSYAPPNDETEEKLARIWSEVLGIEKESIGIESSFFDLGGHSLNLIRMKTKIKEGFNKDIPIATMFRLPTISALSKYIQEEEINFRVSEEVLDESVESMDETLKILTGEEYNDEQK
jgi:amino acid adenylation domain-containing protein